MKAEPNPRTPELDVIKQIRVDLEPLLQAEREKGRALLAVTHVSRKFLYPENSPPTEADFVAYRRMIQRRASLASKPIRLLAIIEMSLNEEAGVRHYQIGLHGVAVVPTSGGTRDFKTCKAIVRRAIHRTDDGDPQKTWGRPNDVPKPFKCKEVYSHKGGLRGWLNYFSKSFELGPVVRRCRYRGSNGKRHSKKVWATGPQSRAFAEVLSAVAPHLRVILVGYKRYKGTFRSVTRKRKRFTQNRRVSQSR